MPVEAFENPVACFELGKRESVVLRGFEIGHQVYVAVLEFGGKEFRLALVHGREGAVLLEIEDGIYPAHRIETPQAAFPVEKCEHLSAADLVITFGGLLHGHESIRHQIRPVQAVLTEGYVYAVGGILPVSFIPYYRVDVQTDQRVQFIEFQCVATHLHILSEQTDPASSPNETYLGAVLRGSNQTVRCRNSPIRRIPQSPISRNFLTFNV